MIIRSAPYALALTLGLAFSINYVRADPPHVLPMQTNENGDPIEGQYVADSAAPIEIVQERYPDGQVRIRREVTQDSLGNYILHGTWQMFGVDGNEIASGHYRNNNRHGDWTRVHSPNDAELFSTLPYKEFQGPFVSRASFQDGQLHGKWIILDNQQRKISEWEYANGTLQGTSTWYYASGDLMHQTIFRGGLMEGYNRSWDKESNLTTDDTYQQGRKLAPKVELYESGQMQSEGMYLHAQFVTGEPDDWWNAKRVSYKTVGEDQRHGRWTSWYPSGQKKLEGMYQKDERAGQFTWWYPNSQQALTGSYKDGLRHGPWVWSHKNGQKATKGQFVNGQLSGKWAYWNENGLLTQKIDYEGGPEPMLADTDQAKEVASLDEGDSRTKR